MKDIVALPNGPLLVNVHTADQCAGQRCCIHNPSDHHMLIWEPRWDRGDKQMWRQCPHRLVHPDPDDLWYLRKRWGHKTASLLGIHGCDGCCQPQQKEIEKVRCQRPDRCAGCTGPTCTKGERFARDHGLEGA